MARPREVKGLRRGNRIVVHVDDAMLRDLDHIGTEWRVPTATACYWLLRGLVADARSERFVMAGGPWSERLARWLVSHFADGA